MDVINAKRGAKQGMTKQQLNSTKRKGNILIKSTYCLFSLH